MSIWEDKATRERVIEREADLHLSAYPRVAMGRETRAMVDLNILMVVFVVGR